jgi:APA family basic amino acid/polyamine antiporter
VVLQSSLKALFRKKTIDQILTESELADSSHSHGSGLKRALGVWDLTSFGVAAIIGAGIFSTIGNAAYDGGPAVVFLFIFTAIACGFSAFCYAEFASAIPVSGSAYTYAYASFGEIIAWIIGWDLLMEYAIGNIAVAISWSEYFTSLVGSYGIHIPKYLTTDYLTAYRGYGQIGELLQQGKSLSALAADPLNTSLYNAYLAWSQAPRLGSIPIICNFPALLVTATITWIAYIGIQESKRLANILVAIKVLVVLMVIGLGFQYMHPANWIPFAPNGVSGVMKGVSAVFFAYIGFDAISTTAEECKNPQRDLPRAMVYSLIICTVLYVLVSLVLTGIVNYKQLAVGDPLAFIFGPQGANIPWISGVVSITAVIALSTVFLVFQIGQPRIWMAMSRDGLLPPIFSRIHPKYKTPGFATILTGVVVAVPSLFMNLTEVTDLTSIGTLFAFVLVCGGALVSESRRQNNTQAKSKFVTPYVNSKYIFPFLLILSCALVFKFNHEGLKTFFSFESWELSKHKIPLLFFDVGMLILGVYCFMKEFSLIPILGLSSCAYLMTELGITNWIRFGGWLVIGFCIYFTYGVRHSNLKGKLKAARIS